jgi:ribosomal protein L16 Arg81 hydroxylase
MADFSNYYDAQKSKVDYTKFPALQKAQGLEVVLEHGDTLFMPAGYWHHMEYLDSGFAMSLRALQPSIAGKLHGVWNLFGMRTIDTVMKKTLPHPWYNWKQKKIANNAARYI